MRNIVECRRKGICPALKIAFPGAYQPSVAGNRNTCGQGRQEKANMHLWQSVAQEKKSS